MARLLHCSTHSSETIPLVDGNKRLGWLAVVVFYGLNDVDRHAADDPAYELVMAVETTRDVDRRHRIGARPMALDE